MPINVQSSLFLSYSVYLKNNFGPMYHGYVVTEAYRLGAHQGIFYQFFWLVSTGGITSADRLCVIKAEFAMCELALPFFTMVPQSRIAIF